MKLEVKFVSSSESPACTSSTVTRSEEEEDDTLVTSEKCILERLCVFECWNLDDICVSVQWRLVVDELWVSWNWRLDEFLESEMWRPDTLDVSDSRSRDKFFMRDVSHSSQVTNSDGILTLPSLVDLLILFTWRERMRVRDRERERKNNMFTVQLSYENLCSFKHTLSRHLK